MTTNFAPNAVAANPWLEFYRRYFHDPVAFVREVLGVEPDPWQLDVLAAVARCDRHISIRSGHGVGKTALLAWVSIWWLVTRWPQKTVCTAATGPQLFDALAAEVKIWMSHLPSAIQGCFIVQTESVAAVATAAHPAAAEQSFISFRTSRAETPEAMAGVHADYVLLIVDEASGVPEAVYESGAGSMSGPNAITILAGNPVRGSGKFYDTHHKLRHRWTTFVVNAEEVARAKNIVDEIAGDYGVESNAYRVRVLGEFPKSEDDKIIPFEWLEAATDRDIVPMPTMRSIWGVDCARFGSDRSALAIRQGNVLVKPVQSWSKLDTMELAGRIYHEWNSTLPSFRPSDICVDAIGLGAGVADRLHELGMPARAINVSESAALSGRYVRLRDELWWKAREWFEQKTCTIAGQDADHKTWRDERLAAELSDVKYSFQSNDKLKIEAKDDIKKRTSGGRSPDIADAFVLTFAGIATSATYGSSNSPSWNQPLHRHLGIA